MKNAPWLYLAPDAWPLAWTGAGPVDPETAAAATVALPPEASRHAAGALRLRGGAAAVLFDGCGRKARVRLVYADPRRVVCAPVALGRASRPRPRLAVAVAPPKGRRAAWLVEKCVETGADLFLPLLCARGAEGARAAAGAAEARRLAERWGAWAVSAAKQCRRAWLPRVERPRALSEWLAGRRAPHGGGGSGADGHDPDGHDVHDGHGNHRSRSDSGDLLLVGAPRGLPFPAWRRRVRAARTATAVIGPEGGLTAEEEEALTAAGGLAVCWGPHVLRVETAAVAACVAIRLAAAREEAIASAR